MMNWKTAALSGFEKETIPDIINKTGFIQAITAYPEQQLHDSVSDAADEIIVIALKKYVEENKMTYLIAKKYTDTGCVAVKTESGKKLAALVSYLGLETLDKGIQIVTLSDPEIFGEYKPYHFVGNVQEFINCVFDMCK